MEKSLTYDRDLDKLNEHERIMRLEKRIKELEELINNYGKIIDNHEKTFNKMLLI
jgi:hypothetical protein